MTTYCDLKQSHSKDVSNFKGIFWAFSNKQFDEGMDKIGLNPDDTAKIYSIGGGGYILKERMQDFKDMLKRHEEKRKILKTDKKLLLNALIYELNNHEYCITYDISDALNALGLKKEDIDPAILKKACSIASQSN